MRVVFAGPAKIQSKHVLLAVASRDASFGAMLISANDVWWKLCLGGAVATNGNCQF